ASAAPPREGLRLPEGRLPLLVPQRLQTENERHVRFCQALEFFTKKRRAGRGEGTKNETGGARQADEGACRRRGVGEVVALRGCSAVSGGGEPGGAAAGAGPTAPTPASVAQGFRRWQHRLAVARLRRRHPARPGERRLGDLSQGRLPVPLGEHRVAPALAVVA